MVSLWHLHSLVSSVIYLEEVGVIEIMAEVADPVVVGEVDVVEVMLPTISLEAKTSLSVGDLDAPPLPRDKERVSAEPMV